MNEKTLANTEPEYFNLIMAVHETAKGRIGAPDFVRVLPPRRIRRPAV